MANKGANKEEPSSAPDPDRWYNLSLGSSFKSNLPSSKFCSLRYEFKPASIDKTQAGTLHKNKDNRVTVEFQNNQAGKPKVSFEGSSEDYKENDAVLFFDGKTFRLERLHRAVKRLRHVRKLGESTAAAATSLAAESHSPPVNKGGKAHSNSFSKGVMHSMPFEVERIDVGDSEIIAAKPKGERIIDYPSAHPNPSATIPEDTTNDEMDEELDILNDDDDDYGTAEKVNDEPEKEFHTGIDINIPHQTETDDEIVDVSDDEEVKGQNAAEALRAQVNAEVKEKLSSSSSSSSSSGSDSGSSSSSSDSESSEDVNSV